jgi:hypothetical protein
LSDGEKRLNIFTKQNRQRNDAVAMRLRPARLTVGGRHEQRIGQPDVGIAQIRPDPAHIARNGTREGKALFKIIITFLPADT